MPKNKKTPKHELLWTTKVLKGQEIRFFRLFQKAKKEPSASPPYYQEEYKDEELEEISQNFELQI